MDAVRETSRKELDPEADFPEYEKDYLNPGESEHSYTEGDEELFSYSPRGHFSGLVTDIWLSLNEARQSQLSLLKKAKVLVSASGQSDTIRLVSY